MMLKKLNPKETLSLDTDWFYRKGATIFGGIKNPLKPIKVCSYQDVLQGITRFSRQVFGRFQSGDLKNYLFTIFSFLMLSVLYFSLSKGWTLNLDSLLNTEVSLAQVLTLTFLAAAALATRSEEHTSELQSH